MNIQRLIITVVCLALVAGCGGGGSKPAVVPQTASSAAAASGTKTTATLTLAFPANFHHARFPPPKPKAVTVKGRKTYLTVAAAPAAKTAARKSPQYVNPGAGNIIHVYSYNSQYGLQEATPSGGVSLPSSAQPDGSQIISAAFTAATYDWVEVEELDANGNELAFGEVTNTPIIAGTTNTLQITMDMNARYIVLTTDPVNGADATVISSTDDGYGTGFCTYANGSSRFYAFAADSTGGYVLPNTPAGAAYDNNAGQPAIPTPTLNGTYSTVAATPLGLQSLFPSSNMTNYTPFVENNPDINFGGRTYGYATLGDANSTPCTLQGSFSDTYPSAGENVTLTLSGGNAPYAVMSTDGNCSVSATSSTYVWTVVPQASGIGCGLLVTDKNAGNSTTLTLYSSEGYDPMTLSPSYQGFAGYGEVHEIYISGGVPPYTIGTSSDNNVWIVTYSGSSSFEIQSETDWNSCATMTVTDSIDNSAFFSAGAGC